MNRGKSKKMVEILIVEDNINYAISLMNYINMENSNIKVCAVAKNGNEALEILEQNDKIDVILLDLKLPGVSRNRNIGQNKIKSPIF